MIYFLKGFIHSKQPTFVIIDVNGVGYGVVISANTASSLGNSGDKAQLLIHHHITEMGQTLFGFSNQVEKDVFEKLITVKGIGPKMGITIVSGMSADQIHDAIANADVGMLSRIPGIGKKTAERIVLELKDKLGSISSKTESSSSKSPESQLSQDAISALISLGYKQLDAVKSVSFCLKAGTPYKNASDLVRDALKQLNA